MARTNFDIKGAGGISAFIVDSQTPGISLGKRDKNGTKGAHTCDVILKIAASLLRHSLVVLKVLVLKRP